MISINTIRDRLADLWPHDDSPGYSDYPEVDIKAHRSNARMLRRLGYLAGAAGVASSVYLNHLPFLYLGIACAVLASYGARSFRLQALEWEMQLVREDNEEETQS